MRTCPSSRNTMPTATSVFFIARAIARCRRGASSCGAVVAAPLDVVSRPVAGELPGYPAGSRAALESPAQGIAACPLDVLRVRAEILEPMANHRQIVVLAERVEGDPQAE